MDDLARSVATRREQARRWNPEPVYSPCVRYPGVPLDKSFITTGQDMSDFISLNIHTGLRISDIVTFRAE